MANSAGRVGQSRYWTIFGINMVSVPVLLFAGFWAFLHGSFGLGFLLIALMLPMGIYFRITMMRRCRDIGWPAFLPWLFMILPMFFGFFSGIGRMGSMGAEPSLGALAVPLTISLCDFAFSIVIGCIAPKDNGGDYADIFGGDPIAARPMRAQAPMPQGYGAEPQRDVSSLGEPDYSKFDDAIARALEKHQHGPDDASLQPEPAAHERAVAGFGRKAV